MRRLKRSTAKFYRCLVIDGYGGAVEGAHKIHQFKSLLPNHSYSSITRCEIAFFERFPSSHKLKDKTQFQSMITTLL